MPTRPNCWVLPLVIVGLVGEIATELSVGAVAAVAVPVRGWCRSSRLDAIFTAPFEYVPATVGLKVMVTRQVLARLQGWRAGAG